VGDGGAVNLVKRAVAPTPLYIALCVGDPPTTNRLGAPAKGARTSATTFGPLGLGVIETNTPQQTIVVNDAIPAGWSTGLCYQGFDRTRPCIDEGVLPERTIRPVGSPTPAVVAPLPSAPSRVRGGGRGRSTRHEELTGGGGGGGDRLISGGPAAGDDKRHCGSLHEGVTTGRVRREATGRTCESTGK
jgi:hypothetical protein